MSVDVAKLKVIVEATAANAAVYVGQVVGQPMLAYNPPLIEINTAVQNPADPTEVICRSTPAAADYLKAAPATSGDKLKYAIITNAELPAPKRRGNSSGSGAPTKYPFAELEVNASFFSANSEHKNKDAVKALGSTVSAQNDKYSEQVVKDGVPQTKTVTRAVRDKQTKKAKLNPDGSKVTETVELPVKKYNRKFTIRPVEEGKTYGGWTAPENGALIARIL
jgi:hypothetical protein